MFLSPKKSLNNSLTLLSLSTSHIPFSNSNYILHFTTFIFVIPQRGSISILSHTYTGKYKSILNIHIGLSISKTPYFLHQPYFSA